MVSPAKTAVETPKHIRAAKENLIEDFFPLSGDRSFSDDKAIIGGFGKFRGKSVLVIGHEKGHDTSSRPFVPKLKGKIGARKRSKK